MKIRKVYHIEKEWIQILDINVYKLYNKKWQFRHIVVFFLEKIVEKSTFEIETGFDRIKQFAGLDEQSTTCVMAVRLRGVPSVESYTMCTLYNDGDHLYLKDLTVSGEVFNWVSYRKFCYLVKFVESTKEFNIQAGYVVGFSHRGHRDDVGYIRLGVNYDEKLIWSTTITIPKNKIVVVTEETQKNTNQKRRITCEYHSPL